MKLLPRTSERLEPAYVTSRRQILEHLGRYVFAWQHLKGNTVLDIACATGYGSNFLFRKGSASVTGADLSEKVIAYAKGRYIKDGLNFVVGDAQHVPFPDSSFDSVVSMETIEHLPDYQEYLRECKRVLRPGGVFICSTPNKNVSMPVTGEPNPFHIKEFTSEEFDHSLSQYFNHVTLYGYMHWKHKSAKDRIINVPVEMLYSLPGVLQTVSLSIIAFSTRFVLKDYHPLSLENIDEEDFDNFITESYKTFPLETAIPQYFLAVGYK